MPASTELLVNDGEVTYRFPNAHTNSTVLGIAQTGLSAELTIETGTLTLQQNLFMAATAGHTGTLNVTGSGTALVASSATGVTSIGEQGTGTINVVDGASMTVANSPSSAIGPRVGDAHRRGRLGDRAVPRLPHRQQLRHRSHGAGLNGTGTGGVIFGGQMDVSSSIQLGKNVGGVGSLVVVAGIGGSDSARVNVDVILKIARNDVAGVGAGSWAPSRWAAAASPTWREARTHSMPTAAPAPSRSTTADASTRSLFVGNPATELDFGGGRLQVRGGTLDLDGNPLVINSSTGSPTLELHDNAQAIINSPTAPALNVGENANGTLKVLFGSYLTVHDFNAVVGDDAGGTGTLEVSHAGSTLTVDQMLLVVGGPGPARSARPAAARPRSPRSGSALNRAATVRSRSRTPARRPTSPTSSSSRDSPEARASRRVCWRSPTTRTSFSTGRSCRATCGTPARSTSRPASSIWRYS